MLIPGRKAPDLDLPRTDGSRFVLSRQSPGNFSMLIFYRGLHCAICRRYLTALADRLHDFIQLGIMPVAISMDDEKRALKTHQEWDTGDIPIAYAMPEDAARQWGLYISSKREGEQEPDIFAEPGLFLVRPDMELFFAQIQSAPFTRPNVDELLQAMRYVIENDYPVRGTLTA